MPITTSAVSWPDGGSVAAPESAEFLILWVGFVLLPIHSLQLIAVHASGLGTFLNCSDLDRVFSGGDREAVHLPAVSSFTGQLDAYSDKQFKDYVVLHKGQGGCLSSWI